MNAIPRLRARTRTSGHPSRCTLDYREDSHRLLPHVVKFSGGRSSAMLLFTLLANGILKQERGDVVVFNNTSCEHPQTYRFVAECKRRVERTYGIPMFSIEFQTYEDARRGQWRRLPSYRMVNERPRSAENPDGLDWRGNVFEEMVSHKAYLPNRHRRTCTAELKLGTTREFLCDWLANKSGIDALGHGAPHSRVDVDEMYARHLRAGGGVPREILLEKRHFVLGRPPNRPAQTYERFSEAARTFDPTRTRAHVFGRKAVLGKDAVKYVSLIGLRGDEPLRIAKVRERGGNPHASPEHDGEHVYMPFEGMGIDRGDVNRFWNGQSWDLQLEAAKELSNCVYCFMKGAQKLGAVHKAMHDPEPVPGFGPTTGTPSDIRWWERIEALYGRDLVAENRMRRENTSPDEPTRIGFFGLSKVNYPTLRRNIETPGGLGGDKRDLPSCGCGV